jgi:hypothetical protein
MGGVAAFSVQALGWLTVESAALRTVWSMLHVAALTGNALDGALTLAFAQTQNLGRWYLGHSPSRLGFGLHIGLGLVAWLGPQSSALVCGLRQCVLQSLCSSF